MITKHMRKYLENPEKKFKVKSGQRYVKYLVYMMRMQRRIDQELEMLLWLVQNRPEVFLEEHKINGKKRTDRLRSLMLILKALSKTEPVLIKQVLENEQDASQ